jgi:hypothetical protein
MKVKIKSIIMPMIGVMLLLLAVIPGPAQGQSPLTATVDRTALSTDDTVVLTVTVDAEGANIASPTLPDLPSFNIVGSSQSSQISIVNGSVSTQIIFSYRLQPLETGQLVIDPIEMSLNGQTYRTEPISVQVTQGTGAPSQAPPSSGVRPGLPSLPGLGNLFDRDPFSDNLAGDAFVEAEVDKQTPYVGEQVIYTFRFLHSSFGLLDQPTYEPPAFTGFWSEEQPDRSQYQTQRNGQTYSVTELRTVLFPSKTGTLTIDPAQLMIPGGFFSAGSTLQTDPLTVEVKPLPPDAPADFKGAVGQYTLEATVDPTQSKVNEPVTWQVVLSGQGNLNVLPDPDWPEVPNWRSFDSQATVETKFENGLMQGRRVYEPLLVPQAAGDFTLPALTYTYFNPATEKYETTSSQPIPVSIAPGAEVEAQPPAPVPANNQKATEVPAPTDIHPLKDVPVRLNLAQAPVTGSSFYWLAWAVPVAGLVANFVWKRRQQFWTDHPDRVRSSQARKKARAALAAAQKQRHDLYDTAGQVLLTYLSDKLNQPVVGLTRQALAALLLDQGLQPDLIERVNGCLAETESGRFAPEANDPGHAEKLVNTVDHLIGDLEKAF